MRPALRSITFGGPMGSRAQDSTKNYKACTRTAHGPSGSRPGKSWLQAKQAEGRVRSTRKLAYLGKKSPIYLVTSLRPPSSAGVNYVGSEPITTPKGNCDALGSWVEREAFHQQSSCQNEPVNLTYDGQTALHHGSLIIPMTT